MENTVLHCIQSLRIESYSLYAMSMTVFLVFRTVIPASRLHRKLKEFGITESPITFATWMAFGVPLSFTLVILVWLWLQIFFLRCG